MTLRERLAAWPFEDWAAPLWPFARGRPVPMLGAYAVESPFPNGIPCVLGDRMEI